MAHLRHGGRRARRAYGALGLRVRGALTWEPEDRRTARWWPQGISHDHEHEPGDGGLLLTTWYSRKVDGVSHGSRLSLVDPTARRYEHVLLVEPRRTADGAPSFRPLGVHAGGLVWWRDTVHVAATRRGFATCHLDDLVRVPKAWSERCFGHRWVLPMRLAHRAVTDGGVEPLRYSFLSLDHRDGEAPALVVGEYGRGRATRRLTRWRLDPASGLPVVPTDGGVARPLEVLDGVAGMQGALRRDDDWLVSTSHGPGRPGSLWTRSDAEEVWRRHRWATPVGPEDLALADGRAWTVTEHPRRRWVVAMSPPRRR